MNWTWNAPGHFVEGPEPYVLMCLLHCNFGMCLDYLHLNLEQQNVSKLLADKALAVEFDFLYHRTLIFIFPSHLH